MKTLKEKLKDLVVLDKFEANLKAYVKTRELDMDRVLADISSRQTDSNKLQWAFSWPDTPEGFKFWHKVYNKLVELESWKSLKKN